MKNRCSIREFRTKPVPSDNSENSTLSFFRYGAVLVIVLILSVGQTLAAPATYVNGRYINENIPDSNFQQPGRPLEHAGGFYARVWSWTFWDLPVLGSGEVFGDAQYNVVCERYGSSPDAYTIEVHKGVFAGHPVNDSLTWNIAQNNNLIDATVWAEQMGPTSDGNVITWVIPAALLNSVGSGGRLQLVTKYRDDIPGSQKADWFGGSSDTGVYQPAPTLAVNVITSVPADCDDIKALGLLMKGDLNEDCNVGFADLAEFLMQWLWCNDPEDLSCLP